MIGLGYSRTGYSGQVRTVRHCSGISGGRIKPVHCARNCTGLKVMQTEDSGVDKMLNMGFIEQSKTKCIVTIVFAHETNESLRHCDDRREAGVIMCVTSIRYWECASTLFQFVKSQYFQHGTQITTSRS